jgi:gamma-glutamyltranspeptidase/glutathione hydrolase
VSVEHHGWTVCKTGPWGQGPVLLQQLRLLEEVDLAGMGLGSTAYVHTVAECAKLAFADREAWYGDPAAVDVPLDALLDPGYAERRRALVGEEASLALRPGSPAGRTPRLPAAGRGPDEARTLAGAGEPTFGDTCHVDVVDRHGNLVAATPSGGWLQSSPVVPGLGFCLGTRAQMLWLEEGLASSLRPGTRPRTTLSPSLALRDGEPSLAFGTPGGDGQDQWSLQFLLAHARFGLDLQEAIDAPTFLSEHFPSSFWPRRALPGRLLVEASHGRATLEGLAGRGHLVEVADAWSLGRTCAAGRDPASGFLVAAANPRGRQAYAVGR